MRKHIVKFRVTLLEKRVLQKRARESGLSMSEFLRRLMLDKEIKYRLTEEEIICYKNLSKYADNFRRISNLFKKGDVTGMKQETLNTAYLIRKHIEKFQK